jgi:peptide/nickel transport system permease protein
MAGTAIQIDALARDASAGRRASAGFWSDAWWRLRHDLTTMLAIVVFLTLVVLALSADLLADNFFHWSFAKQDLLNTYAKPTLSDPAFWLGGDHIGRSQVVRLLYGARVSLFIGTFGMLVTLSVGLVMGISAGYFRGWWDDVCVWLVSTLRSIPTLYLLLIIGLLFKLDPLSLAVFLGLLGWTGIANLARGQTFALRERDFVTAARTIGATPVRIMFRHIFPNLLPLMIVIAAIDVAGIILAESAISYIGFGIQPPVPSWGNMLNNASTFLFKGPHLIYGPGIAIALTVLCLYLIGDGLRDALDPRLRGSVSGGGRTAR